MLTAATTRPAHPLRAAVLLGLLSAVTVGLTPGSASADSTYYLTDTEPVAAVSKSAERAYDVSGRTFLKSVGLSLWFADRGEVVSADYNLSRKCTSLTLTHGISDTALPAAQVSFEILADGVRKHVATSAYGTATPVTLDVTGVLRLRLAATAVVPSTTSRSYAVFGDAQVTCTGVQPARLTVAAGAPLVSSGGASTLSGAVTDVGGSAVADREVTVLARSAGRSSFEKVGTAVTGPDGRWSWVVRPTLTTRYAAEVRDSDGDSLVTGDRQPVVAVRSTVNIGAQRLNPRYYRFFGRVSPGHYGKSVLVYRKAANGTGVVVGRTTTDSDGTWDVYRTFTGSGRFVFYALATADGYSGASRSADRLTSIN